MGGGGDEVAVGHGVGMDSGGDEAGDVGDIEHDEGADFVGDLAEFRRVDDAGIGAGAADDHLGMVLAGKFAYLVEVDGLGFAADAVGDDIVEFAGEVDGGAVGEVSAVGEVHGQDGVAGLELGEVDGHVGLAAGVGLDVDVVAAEDLFGAVAGEVLGLVDDFAAAVVAFGGVAFGVLVGEHGAHGGHDGARGEVLGGDQLDLAVLAPILFDDDVGDLGVNVPDVLVAVLVH